MIALDVPVVRREGRRLVVLAERGSDELVLQDPTGDIELIIDLLLAGLGPEEVILSMTGHRDGVSGAFVSATLERLQRLGLTSLPDGESFPLAVAA